MKNQNNTQTNNKGEVTQFNSAIACLQRIDGILQNCNYLSGRCFFDSEGNKSVDYDCLIAWKLTLLSLLREISIKLNQNDINEIHISFSKFDNIRIIYSTSNKKTGINKFAFSQAWEQLHMLELKLRKFADEKGMLMINKVKDSEATKL